MLNLSSSCIRKSPRMTFAAMLLVMLATPSGAAPFVAEWSPGSPCFARTYDAKHLAAHPRQRLTQFAVAASSEPGEVPKGEFVVTFSFRVKGGAELYWSDAYCRGDERSVQCSVEGDGGHFTMRKDGKGLLLTIDRVSVEGEKGFSPDVGVGGDDRLVRLYPSPKSACRFD